MNTIVIPVSKDRPEDDILTLVETFKSIFPGQFVKVTDALVVETDIPSVAAIFKQIAGTEISPTNGKVKEKRFQCIDCGAPVSKPGIRCKPCAMRLVGEKNRKKTEEVINEPVN